MLSVIAANDRLKLAGIQRTGWKPSPELIKSVAAIVEDVRLRGDAALVEYMRSVCDGQFDASKLRVAIPMTDQARALVPVEIADAFRLAKQRITKVHERERHADVNWVDEDGTRYSMRYRPLDSVAVYVPGGSNASAVLMSAVPAKIAGVSRVIVLAHPDATGSIHPAVVFAASLCDVDELYAVGGAHAIAAAAYGTQSIVPVDKIVGTAPPAVTEAKRQVYGMCGIDTLSGPPEVLVIADDGANTELVTGELLAQAERDRSARVAVVSESRPLLDAVAQLIDTLDVKTLPRGDVIAEVVGESCYLIHAESRDELFDAANGFAPERVALHVRDAEPYLARLRRAGAVFVGDLTPIACGDYLAGTNSVQPSYGAARFSSGLSLADFTRNFSVVENSRERMLRDSQPLAALSDFEGLPQHAQTARMRSGA
ncbi:MAG: histidinol dehydrogenase [Candidatus Eremiobacteraeota bacterium]|nr:histidinol dehydrogenase [Candidatus Eremiobacteraeota bacterium]